VVAAILRILEYASERIFASPMLSFSATEEKEKVSLGMDSESDSCMRSSREACRLDVAAVAVWWMRHEDEAWVGMKDTLPLGAEEINPIILVDLLGVE